MGHAAMTDWQRTHDWGTLTRAELADARDAGALPILTVGSCEQHGDHLPVDTDSVSAYQVARRAAERCASPHVLVLPPTGYGFSPHHREWPGTITLSLATFVGLVTDVAESLHRTGWDRLLIVNGHGGNQGPLASACTELASRGLRVAAVTYFTPGQAAWLPKLPGQKRGVGHACAYETAMQMALRPEEAGRIGERVASLPARLVPSYLEGDANPFAGSSISYAALFPAGHPGYYGDPAAATPEAGAALLEDTVAALARFYAAFAGAGLRVGAP